MSFETEDIRQTATGARPGGEAGERARRRIAELYAPERPADRRPRTKQQALQQVDATLRREGMTISRRQLEFAWKASAPPEAKRPGQRGKRG